MDRPGPAVSKRRKPATPKVGTRVPSITPTIQDYLRTMLLIQSHGAGATVQRLHKFRQVSVATVWMTMRRMEQAGLVSRNAGLVELTEEGMRQARMMTRRHRVIECFLADILKIPLIEVYHQADELEHVVSDRIEDKMMQLLDSPLVCPHGNPIDFTETRGPGSDTHLSGIKQGTIRITRMLEVAAFDKSLMSWLERKELVPGNQFQVAESGENAVLLRSCRGQVRVPYPAAQLLMASVV